MSKIQIKRVNKAERRHQEDQEEDQERTKLRTEGPYRNQM